MNPLKPVLQDDPTGCGFACVATVARVPYHIVKRKATQLGIQVTDDRLWSDTAFVRKLLAHFGIQVVPHTQPFRSWATLPPLALLAIKWHRKGTRDFWHWVVFWRSTDGPRVLDPKRSLAHHLRTDFGRMHPKWYMTIHLSRSGMTAYDVRGGTRP